MAFGMRTAEAVDGLGGPRYVDGLPFDFGAVAVEGILPHRPPVVMIDRLVGFTPQRTETELKVSAGCVFFEDGHLSAEGLMENAAQTNAARIGFINKYIDFRPVTAGYICRIRDFKVLSLPVEGDVLRTVVDLDGGIGAMTKVSATVYRGGEVMACGAMTTMEADLGGPGEGEASPDALGRHDGTAD